MGNLQAAGNGDQNNNINVGADDAGYLSDGLIHNKKRKAAHERKKGTCLYIPRCQVIWLSLLCFEGTLISFMSFIRL